MTARLQITSRDFTTSESLNERIRAEFEELTALHEKLTACHVTLAIPHQHKRQGKEFQVTVTLELPGTELVVSHHESGAHDHEDPFGAVADAFATLRRRLQDHLERQRDVRRRGSTDEAA